MAVCAPHEGNIANLTKLEKHTDWGREVLAQEADNEQLVKTKRRSCLNSLGSGLDIGSTFDRGFDMKHPAENRKLFFAKYVAAQCCRSTSVSRCNPE